MGKIGDDFLIFLSSSPHHLISYFPSFIKRETKIYYRAILTEEHEIYGVLLQWRTIPKN